MEYGYRAALVLALGSDTRQVGVLWLVHREPNVYGASHARALQPIADLATLAVEHDLLQALTQERRPKQEALEALLPTLARALDVQAVFAQISEVTRSVLAHDDLTLGLLSPDGRGFKMYASSLGVVSEAPEYRVTSEREADAWQWDFYIGRDRPQRRSAGRRAVERRARSTAGACLARQRQGAAERSPPEPSALPASLPSAALPPQGVSLDTIERELIQKAMAQATNNKSEAARLLGLARGQLYSRLKRHGL